MKNSSRYVTNSQRVSARMLDLQIDNRRCRIRDATYGGTHIPLVILFPVLKYHVIQANGGHTDPPLFRAALTSSTYLPPQYPADHIIPTVILQLCHHQWCSSHPSLISDCMKTF